MKIALRAPALPPPPAARPPLVGLRLEEVAGLHDDLAAYHRGFAPLFRRAEQRHAGARLPHPAPQPAGGGGPGAERAASPATPQRDAPRRAAQHGGDARAHPGGAAAPLRNGSRPAPAPPAAAAGGGYLLNQLTL